YGVRTGQPLQLQVARLAERTGAHVALDELAELRRHEDLAAHGLASDARGEDDVPAVKVVAVRDNLTGVQADAHLHALTCGRGVPVERALDRDGAVEALLRRAERDHETVAHRLH